MIDNSSNITNTITITIISSDGSDSYEVDSPFRLKNLDKFQSKLRFHCTHAECGSCLIEIVSGIDGVSKVDKIEKKFLKSIGAKVNERLACRCVVDRDISIKIVNEEEKD